MGDWPRWFHRWWWEYMFASPCSWSSFWCRMGNHKPGIVYYNFNHDLLEPDTHCKGCGDELG